MDGIDFKSETDAGAPPLRGPLFMIATVGAMVRTRVGWFELSMPWWVTWNTSIGPIMSVGQTSRFSTFQVKSPQSRKSNLPKRNRRARLRALSEGSAGLSGGAASQSG